MVGAAYSFVKLLTEHPHCCRKNEMVPNTLWTRNTLITRISGCP